MLRTDRAWAVADMALERGQDMVFLKILNPLAMVTPSNPNTGGYVSSRQPGPPIKFWTTQRYIAKSWVKNTGG